MWGTPFRSRCVLISTFLQAFFPTGRGRWKQKSSFVPPKKIAKGGLSDSDDDVSYDEDGNPRTKSKAKESKHGPDVYVKKGYSWSEQLGIAIACLIEDDKMALVDWVKEILIFVIGSRQRIVDETDDFWGDKNKDDDGDPDADPDEILRKRAQKMIPSADAARKFEDYVIPYETQDKADAATKNPHLKLVFRLVKFFVTEEDADELEWYVPAAVIPDELQRSLNVIEQFIKEPLDLKGKRAKEMLGKKRAAGSRAHGGRRRRRRGALGSGDEEGLSAIDLDDVDDDDEPRKKRKKKEKEIYKSAQFIQDSDAELGDDDEFFEKERALREKTALAAVEGGGTMGGGSNMAPTGTKKRKKKTKEVVAKKFKTWKAGDDGDAVSGRDRSEEVDDNDSDADEDAPPPVPKPRPKPRRLRASSPGMLSNATSAAEETDPGTMNDGNSSPTRLSPPTAPRPRPKPRRRFGGGSTAADGDPLTSSPSRAASVAEDDEDDDISRDSVPAKGPTPDGDSTNEVSFGAQEEEDDEPVVNLTQRRRKPIVIASDEEE
ncbi:Topoisomerase 1-associated factor 1 [Tulasnella sp. 418]|nr:Topoisomerase 1-associated factor 1 [Tulasnella sp. 418]